MYLYVKKRVVINAITINDTVRGVERYLIELIKNLESTSSELTYYIIIANWQHYLVNVESSKVRIVKVKLPKYTIFRHLWHAFVFPFYTLKYKADVVHLPNTMPLVIKFKPTVTTAHDLLPEYRNNIQMYSKLQTVYRKIIVKLESKLADKIICVSSPVMKEFKTTLRINENKFKVITNGISNDFCPIGMKKEDFLLFVGVIDKVKNLSGLIQAYCLLPDYYRDKYKIVIIGRNGNASVDLREQILAKNLVNSVIFKGHIDDARELNIFYNKAACLVFPSFSEGFGLPILEALAAGCPVITSNNSIFKSEITDGLISYIDPNNVNEIKEAIMKVISVQNNITEISKKFDFTEYSWEKTANKTSEVYLELMEGR